MPYWDIVTRSFLIPWRHRYLWLVALFAGEGAAGSSFNYNVGTPTSRTGGNAYSSYNINAFPQQAAAWLNSHIGLVVAIVVIWLLLVVGFFVLAAVCEGAVVRGSAEHDAERPFSLGVAWRSGVRTMGAIIRFRLLLIALGLPAVLIIAALAAGVVLAMATNHAGVGLVVGLVGLFFVLVAVLYAIYLSFLDRLGTRALVLEQLGARASLVRGHRLLVKRIGRVLLVWLLAIAVGIGVGIALFIAYLVLSLPAIAAVFGALAFNSAILWIVAILYGLALLVVLLVVQGFVSAQASTYWTLAFRRLDVEYPAAYAVPSPAAGPQPLRPA